MKIGYLMNWYPVTSTTFIRREIHAHEAAGVEVVRYSTSPWPHPLVDPRDKAEVGRTVYILPSGKLNLIGGAVIEALTNPIRVARALGAMWRLNKAAGGSLVKHVAYLVEAVFLKRHARRNAVEHIHAHWSTNTAAVAMMSKILGGPGYSFTAHGPYEFMDVAANATGTKVENADFVVAITDFAKGVLDAASGGRCTDKIHVIRCGLDFSDFEGIETAPFEGNQTFASIGRLCPEKSQPLIVEAVGRLVADFPDLRVVLVGDGDSRADIEASIVRLGVEDNIVLAGWGTNAEVIETLAKARALLLPSLAEGLPIVIMESFALRRPVISTTIAGIPELVDSACGWLVAPSSLDDLEGAMRDALSADAADLTARGEEGRRRVEEHHDQAGNAQQIRDRIAEVLAR